MAKTAASRESDASQQAEGVNDSESPKSESGSTRSLRKWLIRLVFLATIPGMLSLSYLWFAKQKTQQLKSICVAAREAEDWPALEEHALSWYQWQPEIAEPLLQAAVAAQEQNKPIDAAVYLSRLPDEDPKSILGLLTLADMEYGLFNRPLDAEKTWRRILRIAPKNAFAHKRVSFFYAMSRQRSKMLKEARRALEVGSDVPTTYVYLFGADWMTFTNGGQLNNYWLENAPGEEIFEVARGYHYTRTMAFSEEVTERDAEGMNVLERQMVDLLAKYKSNPELLAYHLDLATYRGDMENVLVLLENAPPETVDDSRFWRYKGWVHENRGETKEAIKSYLQALELYPYDYLTHLRLSTVYRQTRELDLVAKHQKLSDIGNEIMRLSVTMPDLDNIPTQLFDLMITFAEEAGETEITGRLQDRVAEQGKNQDN